MKVFIRSKIAVAGIPFERGGKQKGPASFNHRTRSLQDVEWYSIVSLAS
ncbi:MAG TPA: hypothetical protein VNI02_23880 [Blastocatellia bacterium]|jgi:hypothetical protein|nr:hypothetical protein [Blastocatellia bacterium]